MKIGVRAHDLSFETIDQLIDICHQHDITGLQLVVDKTFSADISDEQLKDEIDKLKVNGISIYLLGAYFNMIHPNDEKLQSGIERFKKNIRYAVQNNLDYIGSETGSVNGDEWTYHPDNHTEQSYAKLEDTITQITADLQGKKYLLEPVYDHVAYNHQIASRMLSGANVKMTFDLANVLNVENYTAYLEIFKLYVEQFGTKIRLFHFKNFNVVDGKKISCELSQGIIDYSQIIKVLDENNMNDVPIIVEELEGEELFNSISYLKEMEK